MADESSTKRLTYWQAVFVEGKVTFEQALEQTLEVLPDWQQRQCNVVSLDDGEQVFLNKAPARAGYRSGEVLHYLPGRDQAAIDAAQNGHSVNTVRVIAKLDEERKGEFVGSSVHLTTKDNRVVLCCTREIRTRELETYFTVIFRKAKVISDTDGVAFERGLVKDVAHEIAANPPTSLTIGTPLFDDVPERKKYSRSKSSFLPTGLLWQWLDKYRGKTLDDLKLDNSIDPDSIRVQVKVTYRRKTDEQSGKVMKQLAQGLRHLESSDVSIAFPKTGTLKGDKLFLETSVQVPSNRRIVAPTAMYDAMSKWLKQLLDRKLIS